MLSALTMDMDNIDTLLIKRRKGVKCKPLMEKTSHPLLVLAVEITFPHFRRDQIDL